MYSSNGYGGQRPVYDNSRPDDYRPPQGSHSGYGNRGSYGSRDVGADIRAHALAFLEDICRGLDAAMNNGSGERLYGLVERALDRQVSETVRYFDNFVRVAGNDDPAIVAGVTTAGVMMANVIQQSDQRVRDDILNWARKEWEIICNTANDFERIIGRTRSTSNYGSRDQPQQSGASTYGSGGQKTSLVNPQEPAQEPGERKTHVAMTSMASLFMEAEAESAQPTKPVYSHGSDDQQQDDDNHPARNLIDPMRPQTGSVLDWMSDRDPKPVNRENEPTRAATYAPVNNTPQPAAEPFQYGSDPIFNSMYDNMQAAAGNRDAAAHAVTSQPVQGVDFVEQHELPVEGGEVIFKPNYDDLLGKTDNDGVMEDFDDVSFDPTDPSHDALALLNFAARTLVDPVLCKGWKFYESDVDGQIPYDRSVSPYPMAYDALHFVKFRFVNPQGKLVEFIKPKYPEGTDMEMQDHIEEMLVVRSAGSSINILEILQNTEKRVPTAHNRKEVKADTAKGIEAKVATADRKAFDGQVRNTTSDSIARAIKSKLASERAIAIEGFNERRLTPVYLGKEGVAELEKFRHIVAAAATFSGLVNKVKPALDKMPETFQTEYRNRLTARFNDFLRNRMAMDFEIEDFFEDYEDAKTELADQLGENTATDKLNIEFKSFGRFAKIMPREAGRYPDVLGKDLATNDYVVFVTTMATINLPFESVEGLGVVPDEDERFIGVAESQNPHLYKLLTSVATAAHEVFNNPAEIIRVITTDDKVYYVDKGAFSVDGDCYIVSHRNRVAELLS